MLSPQCKHNVLIIVVFLRKIVIGAISTMNIGDVDLDCLIYYFV